MYLRECVRLLCVFVLLATAACGQKGPLFLPGDASELQPVVPDELTDDEQADAEGSEDSPAGSGS